MKQEIVRTSKESAKDVVIYNVPQKKCWAMAAEQLQPFLKFNIDWLKISREDLASMIPLDQNYMYRFEIDKHDIANYHRKQALAELLDMAKILISGVDGDGNRYSFFFLSGLVENNGKLYGLITMQGLRWILDFGKKHLFVAFHKPSFLKLSSAYSMDLFLLLSENYNKGVFDISIEDFRKRLSCPDYDAQNIKKRILVPAQKEFFEKQTILTFQYTFYSKDDKPSSQGRKRLNMIQFGILRRNYDLGSVEPTNEEAWTRIRK